MDGEVEQQGLQKQFKWQTANGEWFMIVEIPNCKPFEFCHLPFAICHLNCFSAA